MSTRCLAKSASARPANAGALLAELDRIDMEGTWNAALAAAWWQTLEQPGATKIDPQPDTPSPNATLAYQDPIVKS